MRQKLFIVLATVLVQFGSIQAQTQPTMRMMPVKVLEAGTDTPLANAIGYVTIDSQPGKKFDIDAKGEGSVLVPTDAHLIRFQFHKDHYVAYMISFGEGRGASPIPQSCTVHLLPGVVVGGTIHDEAGNGVEGVRVIFEAFYNLPDRPGLSANGTGVAFSDAQGHWTFAGAPEKLIEMVMLAPQHPDFILSSSHQDVRLGQYDSLRKQTLVTTIQRGITVWGTVRDAQGKPIGGAQIGQDNFGLVNGVQTDDAGQFKLRGVPPGSRLVLAKANGFVAQSIAVEVTDNPAPVEFKLQKGAVVRGRVTDEKGEPLADAIVSVDKLKDLPRPSEYIRTDANGRFKWDGAPADGAVVSVNKIGFARKMNVTLMPGETETAIVLQKASSPSDPFGRETLLTIKGTAVDEQTGAPLEKFTALVTIRRNATPTMSWSSNAAGANGKYLVPVTEAGDTYVVRIDSDDHLPLESPPMNHAANLEFNAKLKPATPLTGVVLQPDGQPAKGADVALREGYGIPVEEGIIRRRGNSPQTHISTSDAAGHFTLPPRDGNVVVFAVHESGWLEWVRNGQGAGEPIRLHEWATVEGTILIGSKPAVGKTVSMRPQIIGRLPEDRAVYPARTFFRYESTTDDQGHFSFDRVLDGPSELSVQYGDDRGNSNSRTEGLTRRINVQPGDHLTLRLGGTGRPVIGKVTLPDNLKGVGPMPKVGRLALVRPTFIPPLNFEELDDIEKAKLRQEFQLSEAYQKYLNSVQTIAVSVKPDGTFRAEDVPAGDYMLSISIYADKPDENHFIALLAIARQAVTVPEIPGGRSSEPLDLSKLEFEPYQQNGLAIKAFKNPKVGETISGFVAQTYDSKPAALADLRGKYVMLEFWATWCGPCIAEMPNLERLHAKWANDPRLAMVSISIDDRMQEPAKFLQNRKLPWVQWYAGAASPQSASEEFGIHAIPSVWLIDPQGKIIARDLLGEAVGPAIEKALSQK
ncbi:MAG TPA: carboxypeptidase regulatory-like domain-containing protein [Humisphaera sp.]|jgi:thiol-disulfide isomerase/thioredoxin/protocatechuate 3,4-dioxygenase beta subunit|nr:carboxypeptidase regulatory-like domain-containing protein [Humisphaera sp.]